EAASGAERARPAAGDRAPAVQAARDEVERGVPAPDPEDDAEPARAPRERVTCRSRSTVSGVTSQPSARTPGTRRAVPVFWQTVPLVSGSRRRRLRPGDDTKRSIP